MRKNRPGTLVTQEEEVAPPTLSKPVRPAPLSGGSRWPDHQVGGVAGEGKVQGEGLLVLSVLRWAVAFPLLGDCRCQRGGGGGGRCGGPHGVGEEVLGRTHVGGGRDVQPGEDVGRSLVLPSLPLAKVAL